jgi:hypothetical protein
MYPHYKNMCKPDTVYEAKRGRQELGAERLGYTEVRVYLHRLFCVSKKLASLLKRKTQMMMMMTTTAKFILKRKT